MLNMPILRPLPIPTKQLGSLARIWKWFASTRQWEVWEDYEFEFDNQRLVIPKGFVFDGASVPRLFWSFLAPTGLLLIPGLFHDYAYRYNYLLMRDGEKLAKYHEGAGKSFWDTMFRLVGQQVNGVHFANLIAWGALACGGWVAWLSKRKAPPYESDIALRGDEEISG